MVEIMENAWNNFVKTGMVTHYLKYKSTQEKNDGNTNTGANYQGTKNRGKQPIGNYPDTGEGRNQSLC